MGSPSRADGAETKKRLLQAATQVFADKGLTDATTAEICQLAKANAAAISYHFGGKEALYEAVWQQATDLVDQLYPGNAGLSGDESAEVCFRAYIHNFVRVVTDDGMLGHLHRLQLHEMVAPTGAVQAIFFKAIEPRRQRMLQVITELVGPDVEEDTRKRCLYSVISQCRSVRFVKNRSIPIFGRKKFTQRDFTQLADHIADMCLAGFVATREKQAAETQNRNGRPKPHETC